MEQNGIQAGVESTAGHRRAPASFFALGYGHLPRAVMARGCCMISSLEKFAVIRSFITGLVFREFGYSGPLHCCYAGEDAGQSATKNLKYLTSLFPHRKAY